MKLILAVAAGGALGAVSRYWVSSWIHGKFGSAFPYGTLTVNVVGSLLMGFLYIVLLERLNLEPLWRGLLLVGFLGAFTTFSTFSLETLNLLELREFDKALLNMTLSLVLCLAAAWTGMNIGRQL